MTHPFFSLFLKQAVSHTNKEGMQQDINWKNSASKQASKQVIKASRYQYIYIYISLSGDLFETGFSVLFFF